MDLTTEYLDVLFNIKFNNDNTTTNISNYDFSYEKNKEKETKKYIFDKNIHTIVSIANSDYDIYICDENILSYISRNPSITIEIIKACMIQGDLYNGLYHNWSWGDLSEHPNITWEIIQANPDLPWCWFSVCKNPNITIKIILENPNYDWWFTQYNKFEKDFKNEVKNIKRNKIIQSRLEKRIKKGCKYSKMILKK
jgi:hypothetical protein